MPTKRGSKPGQLKDQIKRIARRHLNHRKKHKASRSRENQAAAVKLIQFQQHQDRMGVQHEFERLDRYEASAAQLQAEAARQLRRRRATTKTSVTPDGKTRIEFRPVPEVPAGRLHLATVHPHPQAHSQRPLETPARAAGRS